MRWQLFKLRLFNLLICTEAEIVQHLRFEIVQHVITICLGTFKYQALVVKIW